MKKLKVLSIIIATAVTLCSIVGCGNENKDLNKTPNIGEEIEVEVMKPIEETIENAVRPGGEYAFKPSMAFLSSDLEPVAQTNEGVGVVVSCNVYPEDALNKEVDWYIEWSEDATLKNTPVSNYVTVAPTSSGSTTAVVTCYQPFGDDTIVLRVVTRDGGFEDSCFITFVGIPTSMTINTTMTTGTQSTQGGLATFYQIGSNETATMTLTLNNAFNSVNDSFYDQLVVEVAQGPTVVLANEQHETDSNGDTTVTKSNEREVNLKDRYSEFFTFSRSGMTITLTGGKVIENYYQTINYGSRGRAFIDKFQYFVYPNVLNAFTINIQIPGTDIFKSVFLKPVSSVTGVQLSDASLKY